MGAVLTKKVLMGSVAVALALGTGTTVAFAAPSNGKSTSDISSNAKNMHNTEMVRMSMLSTLASDLKLSTSTLQADFKAGKTISEIASAQGVSTSSLISELESTLISQQKSKIDTQVTNFVNGKMPKHHKHGPDFWGPKSMMSALASDLKISSSTLQSDLKSGKTVAEIASAQGVSTSTLVSELEATMKSQLSQAESSGKITSAQESKMAAQIDTQVTNFVNGKMPKPHGHGPGFGGPGKMMTALASDLKISSSTLQSDLKSGKTVAEIASAQGVSTSTLISELEATMKSQLSQAESSGKITSAQESKMAAHMDTQVTNFVNGKMPKPHRHGPGFWGPRSMMTALASDLKISSSTLQSDLKSGKTVAEIASAQGVSTSTLVSKLESAMQAKMATHINTEVSDLVNSTNPPQIGKGHHWMPNDVNTQTKTTLS